MDQVISVTLIAKQSNSEHAQRNRAAGKTEVNHNSKANGFKLKHLQKCMSVSVRHWNLKKKDNTSKTGKQMLINQLETLPMCVIGESDSIKRLVAGHG